MLSGSYVTRALNLFKKKCVEYLNKLNICPDVGFKDTKSFKNFKIMPGVIEVYTARSRCRNQMELPLQNVNKTLSKKYRFTCL